LRLNTPRFLAESAKVAAHRAALTLYDDGTTGIGAHSETNQAATRARSSNRVFVVHSPVRPDDFSLSNPRLRYRGRPEIAVGLHSSSPVRGIVASFSAVNNRHSSVMNWNSCLLGGHIDIAPGPSRLELPIEPLLLQKGRCLWNRWICDGGITPLVCAIHAGSFDFASDAPPIEVILCRADPTGLQLTTGGRTRHFRAWLLPSSSMAAPCRVEPTA
jgi:hypothetical protein